MKTSLILRTVLCSSVLFFSSLPISSLASSIAANDCSAPIEIVKRYVELAGKGETAHTSKSIDELIDYEDGDTPGWDTVYVVSEAKVSGCKIEKGIAFVTIQEVTVGSVSSGGERGDYPTFEPNYPVRNETEVLQLKEKEGKWKIDFRTVFPPHCLKKCAHEMLNARLKDPKATPEIKNKTEEALNALEKIK